jgi:hypothetical protein
MVELAEGQIDDAPSDGANDAANPPVIFVAPRSATSASSAVWQAQLAQLQELEVKLEEERRQTQKLCTALD